MKKILTILLIAISVAALAQEVDERPMREYLDRWHEFYHAEMHKPDNVVGMYSSPYDGEGPNTRRMQLRYFDRRVCRLFAAINDAPSASNFVWQVNEWTTKPLPTQP